MEHPIIETSFEKALIQKALKKQIPIYGSLELTPLCNMRCKMCYVRLDRETMEKNGRLRTADEWLAVAKEMKQSGVLFLLLTGGEPLLYPEFKKLYVELIQLGMILTINTNGTLIDVEWADFFEKYKPRRINITVYGSNESTYEQLCHFSSGYSRTIKGIELLKERGIDVKINGSMTRLNQKDTEDIYSIAEELNIPIHIDTYMLPGIQELNRPYCLQTRLSPEEAAKASMQTIKTEMQEGSFERFVRNTIKLVRGADANYSDQLSCLAGTASFAINWNGEMWPCLNLPQPSVPVFEAGFQNVWERLKREKENILINSKCKNCHLRPVCKTCAASAYWETGRFDGIADYNCRYAETFYKLLCSEEERLGKTESGVMK